LSRGFLRWFMRISNILILAGGIILLGVGIWSLQMKTFPVDLLRNSLYLNTARLLTIVGVLTTLVSLFGFVVSHKEVKVLYLLYFVLTSVLLLILAIGAVLAYVFREQVEMTMKAEMLGDVRRYDPSSPSHPVTWAWDATQSKLSCCGLVTAQVNSSWEIWKYSSSLHPRGEGIWTVPPSCCPPDTLCGLHNNNISNIYTQDCYIAGKDFVVEHAAIMGGVAIAISCIQALGSMSSLVLFKSIV